MVSQVFETGFYYDPETIRSLYDYPAESLIRFQFSLYPQKQTIQI
jgi:hypothetical protein